MRPQPESGGGASQPESGGENTSSRKRPPSDSSGLPLPASKKALTLKQKASRERARAYQAKKMLGAARGVTVHIEQIKRRAPGTIIALALVAFIGDHVVNCRRFKSFSEVHEAWFKGGMPQKVLLENSDEAYDADELVRASHIYVISCC
jgi:hypothetical protein